MDKWPRDPIESDWEEYAAQVDPACVDDMRRDVYLSYESFLRSRLSELDEQRPSLWHRDYSSLQAYERSASPMRDRLKRMLGFWAEPSDRPPLRVWDKAVLPDAEHFTAHRFRMEVAPGLDTYGVALAPKREGPHPGLLAQHGYSGTPELICGLARASFREDYGYWATGLRAVRRGFYVVAVNHPTGYGQPTDEISAPPPGFPDYPNTYGKNRLHRMAIMAGGTLFGLDMLASSRGIDLLMSLDEVDSEKIGMYGLSQGGMSALYLPAMDTRIRASVASAYFNSRFLKLIGPHRGLTYLDSLEEDKFFGEVIRCFSDSDIASLIAPRAFAVEAGVKDSAVDFEKSADEFQRAREHFDRLAVPERAEFIAHDAGHICMTRRALDFLLEHLEEPS